MALSADDAAWLLELKAARRKLILGDKRVKISSGGRAVDYTPADLPTIENEIERLEAAAEGDGTPRRRGRIGFAGWRQ
ncbi:MAG TPA: gpW family head-tail joining protein [Terricaulis sp.]|nr:gpW family head-tail joining protein [Terricaulis sp.]